jgi:hypothetical protein
MERCRRSDDVRSQPKVPAVRRRLPSTPQEQLLALQRSVGNAVAARLVVARKRDRPVEAEEQPRWDKAERQYENSKTRGHDLWQRISPNAQEERKELTAAAPTPDEMDFYNKSYDTTCSESLEAGRLEVTSTHKEDSGVYHVNYFYPDGRIEANSNYGRSTKVETLRNNKIFWIQFNRARESQPKLPVAPAELVRTPIVNRETLEIIWMCLPDREMHGEFAGGTDDMKALLGTENGRAAAFMIIDHRVAKSIASIQATYEPGSLRIRFDQPATRTEVPVVKDEDLLAPTPVLEPGFSARVRASAKDMLTFYEFKSLSDAKLWVETREFMEQGPASSFAKRDLRLIERRSGDSDTWLVETKGDYGPIYAELPSRLLRV